MDIGASCILFPQLVADGHHGVLCNCDFGLYFELASPNKVQCVTVRVANVIDYLVSHVDLLVEQTTHILTQMVWHGCDKWYGQEEGLPRRLLLHSSVVQHFGEIFPG